MTQDNDPEQNEWNGYSAEYCENCGQLFEASDEIFDTVEEPVHRVEIIEAIGPFDEVGETVATEQRECECTGTIVKRYYVYPASNVPEPEYEPDPEDFTGRDPNDDALLAMSPDPDPEDFEEVREISWLRDGDDLDGESDTDESEGRT